MAEDKPIIIRNDKMLDAIGGVSELIENYGDKYLIDSGPKGIVPEERLMEFLRSIGKVGRANMGGMISIDELTKPIGMKKGMTTNPVLNKLLKTKNFGALINEIGTATESMGMGQDLPGVGFEEALQEQPGERVSTKASNVDKDVKRDYIKKGRIELANIKPKDLTVKSVKVGTQLLPFLEKNTQKDADKYIKNTIKYVRGLGDNEAAKIVQGSSFMGATGYGELRNQTWSEAKNDPKILNKFFREVKGKEAENAKFNHKGKSYKLKAKEFNAYFEKKTGYVPKGGAKNFVKLVDEEIVKKGGNLSGKAGLAKNFILNEAQRLFKMGDKKGAKLILTALATSIPTIAKAAGPVTFPLTAIDIIKLSEDFGPGIVEKIQSGLDTVTEPVTSKIAEAQSMFENMLKSKMNQGGMMDINFMTRPMGYKDGTRDGTLVGDKEEIPVREIVRDEPEGIMGTLKSIFSKKEAGTIENPLPLSMVFEPGVSQKTLIDEGAFITTPDGITFKATPFMFDKYLGTKYVENNTFGQRDDVEVEFRPKYITSAEKSFVKPGGVFDQIQTPRKEGRFTEMNQGGIMDINQLTKRIR